eukprot:763945-Hanusia_phi.AAC.2
MRFCCVCFPYRFHRQQSGCDWSVVHMMLEDKELNLQTSEDRLEVMRTMGRRGGEEEERRRGGGEEGTKHEEGKLEERGEEP